MCTVFGLCVRLRVVWYEARAPSGVGVDRLEEHGAAGAFRDSWAVNHAFGCVGRAFWSWLVVGWWFASEVFGLRGGGSGLLACRCLLRKARCVLSPSVLPASLRVLRAMLVSGMVTGSSHTSLRWVSDGSHRAKFAWLAFALRSESWVSARESRRVALSSFLVGSCFGEFWSGFVRSVRREVASFFGGAGSLLARRALESCHVHCERSSDRS